MTKKYLFFVLLMAGVALVASADDLKGVALSTNQTVSVDVVKLLEAKYQRDMNTSEGRKFWHGKLVSHVADPSNVVVITTYEDGRIFKDPAKMVRPIDSVNGANSRLKRTVNRKGVPEKLADARQRRADELDMGVTNVTVTITAGGSK